MFKFIGSLFDDNAKDIKKYTAIVQKVNEFESTIQALSNVELKAKTEGFRRRLKEGEELRALLPEAFAVVREASKRSLGMRHFDVQLIGGMALADGRIAEMKTGEGKTLVATAPAYLNAISGEGVHIVTVNDYLARRDSEWMGTIFRFLGLTVGLVVHGMDAEAKRAAYNADITYGTNNEFGFDYLRDNMAVRPQYMVQRPLNYAIVDEVDSILIDEARTPLIISGASDKPTELYYKVAKVIPRLKAEEDYTVDEKARIVTLTEDGVSRMEQMLGVENLYDDSNILISHHVNQALKAYVLFRRDRDYVVKDGEVIIVDEFTGRLMFGRRYSEGLHQAIEAKENVKIERESQTLATITFQNYFRMYKKLSGMTGTARTEEEEFRKIYRFDVVEIPTNLPMIRDDFPDRVYRSEKGKWCAVVDEIVEEHQKGRPVLVGTISIENSEYLSTLLKNKGVGHQVLNAKHHDIEAEIIAQAGRLNTVTIATNMAGRGTDIVLGGNYQALAQAKIMKLKAENGEDYPVDSEAILEEYRKMMATEHDQVVSLGGLHIIGTERHESRRIDNQLRGRAGRQGDPGSSRFYLSMEADLMRRFGGDNMGSLMDKIGMEEDMPIDSAIITRTIESAQKRVESRNFDIRKNVLEYDDVMNQQREIIYAERRKALYGENLAESVHSMIDDAITGIIDQFSPVSNYPEEWDLDGLIAALDPYIVEKKPGKEDLSRISKEEVYQLYLDNVHDYYKEREEKMGMDALRHLEQVVILKVVDSKWMDHLDAMDQLRQGIGLRAYGQRDPLVEYKHEAFNMFQQMIGEIQEEVARYCMRAEIVEAPKQREVTSENKYEDEGKKPVKKSDEEKIGRNDPCPCGSGKKYKKCCGKDL